MKYYITLSVFLILALQSHQSMAQEKVKQDTKVSKVGKKSSVLKNKMLRLGRQLKPSIDKQNRQQKKLKEQSLHYVQPSSTPKKVTAKPPIIPKTNTEKELVLPKLLPSYFTNLIPDRLSPILHQWSIQWDQKQSQIKVKIDWKLSTQPKYFLSAFQMNIIRYQWLHHLSRNALKQNIIKHKTRGTLSWGLKKQADQSQLLQVSWLWQPKTLTVADQKALLSLIKKSSNLPVKGEIKADLQHGISSTVP